MCFRLKKTHMQKFSNRQKEIDRKRDRTCTARLKSAHVATEPPLSELSEFGREMDYTGACYQICLKFFYYITIFYVFLIGKFEEKRH